MMSFQFLTDSITEADAITDFDPISDLDMEYIDTIRNDKLRSLVGKYVIICDSRYEGILYLQDQIIDYRFKEHYWTTYLSNARGFNDYTQAKIKCGNLRYNNPRVRYVDRNFSLKIPKEDK
jgi:hypothetical protein